MEMNTNEIDRLSIELSCDLHSCDLKIMNLSRSYVARQIAKAYPSTLNMAFIKAMDNPLPFYTALRNHGLNDWDARHRISLLPVAATGGYGLKARCNDLQSSGARPALIRHFQPELFDAIGRAKPAITANEPKLFATNLHLSPQTRIICNCISP